MSDDLRDFEDYLRTFAPRRPKPLAEPRGSWGASIGLAAAVLTAAAALSVLTLPKRTPVFVTVVTPEKKSEKRAVSLGALRALASRDPSALDAALEAESKRVLVDVGTDRGTLGILGRE